MKCGTLHRIQGLPPGRMCCFVTAALSPCVSGPSEHDGWMAAAAGARRIALTDAAAAERPTPTRKRTCADRMTARMTTIGVIRTCLTLTGNHDDRFGSTQQYQQHRGKSSRWLACWQ